MVTSTCRVDLTVAVVLVELIVELLKSLVVAMVAVKVNVVCLGYVERLKRTGHQRHELAEDTYAAMPESWLGKAAG